MGETFVNLFDIGFDWNKFWFITIVRIDSGNFHGSLLEIGHIEGTWVFDVFYLRQLS